MEGKEQQSTGEDWRTEVDEALRSQARTPSTNRRDPSSMRSGSTSEEEEATPGPFSFPPAVCGKRSSPFTSIKAHSGTLQSPGSPSPSSMSLGSRIGMTTGPSSSILCLAYMRQTVQCKS